MATSNYLVICLFVFDFIVGVVCILEKNYPKAMYWFAGSILQLSVFLGFK